MAQTVKRVLKRDFFGPDNRLYHRLAPNGDPLVHTFPSDWELPSSAMTVQEALGARRAKAEDTEPEVETLSEIAKKEGREKTSREKMADGETKPDVKAAGKLSDEAQAPKGGNDKDADPLGDLTKKKD